MSEKFDPSNPEYKKVDESGKEQGDIELARKAYAEAYEGGGLGGKIKQIISSIRGGRLSENGTFRMISDAEKEDSIREDINSLRDNQSQVSKQYIKKSVHESEKQQNSYLNYKHTFEKNKPFQKNILSHPEVCHEDYHKIEGVINGQKVFIEKVAIYRTAIEAPGDNWNYSFHGNINGEEILPEDAERIFVEYENVAIDRSNISTFREMQKAEEEEKIRRQKNLEEVQRQTEIKDKTRGLLEKIGIKESEDKSS